MSFKTGLQVVKAGRNYIIPHCEEFLAAPLDPPLILHVVKVLRWRSISSIYTKHVYIVDREPRKLLSLTQIMLVNNKAEIINPVEMHSVPFQPGLFFLYHMYHLSALPRVDMKFVLMLLSHKHRPPTKKPP